MSVVKTKEMCPHHGEFDAVAEYSSGDVIKYPCIGCMTLQSETKTHWHETFQTALKALLPAGGNAVLQARMIADKAALDYFNAHLNYTHSYGPPIACRIRDDANCFPARGSV